MTFEAAVGKLAHRKHIIFKKHGAGGTRTGTTSRLRELQDIVAPYQHFPGVIQSALLRVESHPSLRLLTPATLATLKALITRASAKNGQAPISARVDRLADEAGVSEKTVRRALYTLAEEGLIGMSERRDDEGVYRPRDYQLSKELCRLLNLPIPGETGQGTQMSDGHIYDLNFKKDLREIQKENPKPPIRLPQQVAELPTATGIKDTGICKLIGMANKAGHQLADVYAIAAPYLAPMLGNPGRVFRYLRTMILNAKPGAYAERAAQLKRMAAEEAQRSLAQRIRGKSYLHTDGTLVKIHDGTAETSLRGQVHFIPGPDMGQVYDDITNGTLVELSESELQQHRIRESHWHQRGAASLGQLGQLVRQARAAPGGAVLAETTIAGDRAPVVSGAFAEAMMAARAILGVARRRAGETAPAISAT